MILSIVYLSVALVILLIFAYLIKSGLFASIEITAGQPGLKSLVIAYKIHIGAYKNCYKICQEIKKLAPDKRTIGIYYDNPNTVSTECLRSAIGCILSEDALFRDADLTKTVISAGYKLFIFPEVSSAVSTTFPYRTQLSLIIAILRVYPKLGVYVKKNRLCAYPWIEIYESQTIQFIAPLAKQENFNLPEIYDDSRNYEDVGHDKSVCVEDRQTEPEPTSEENYVQPKSCHSTKMNCSHNCSLLSDASAASNSYANYVNSTEFDSSEDSLAYSDGETADAQNYGGGDCELRERRMVTPRTN